MLRARQGAAAGAETKSGAAHSRAEIQFFAKSGFPRERAGSQRPRLPEGEPLFLDAARVKIRPGQRAGENNECRGHSGDDNGDICRHVKIPRAKICR